VRPNSVYRYITPRDVAMTSHMSYDPEARMVEDFHFKATQEQVNAELVRRGKRVRAGFLKSPSDRG
jgi:hypothetical protein